jgi:hypothetical protein
MPHAGQHADQIAYQHAEKRPHQIMRCERDAEALPEIK